MHRLSRSATALGKSTASSPYDGDVLMAGFDTYDEAKHVLDRVHDATPSAIDP
jgi:hypothetical protein